MVGERQANKVSGMIVSYVDAGGDTYDPKRLQGLKYLIKTEAGLDLDIEYLKRKIATLYRERERSKKKERLMADVFHADLPEERLRIASGYCPRCRRFKNFRKECPFCSHLEMTK
jgi:hypothetical protein